MDSPIKAAKPLPFWRHIATGDHACQVYRTEEELLETLSGYVGSALWSGESAVVIATDDHVHRLEGMLRQTGLDLGFFRARDRLLLLPAAQTLARFMVGGWPDPALFEDAILPVLCRARGRGREVYAYGEMVALLWAEGHYAAAVRLEHLWNELLARERFRLLCAYPRAQFLRAGEESMAAVCTAHKQVAQPA